MKERIRLARSLRKKQTPAEECLWKLLRRRQFFGKKFLRQHPLPFFQDGVKRFFIADFFCKELMLVIEVDGGIHDEQKEYDNFRTEVIHQLGIKVIRFDNEQVLKNLTEVLKNLQQFL